MSNFHSSRNDLIDVNQNDGLLSSSYRSSKDKQVMELQEQIKAYKKELSKKDELITHLSTITPRSENVDGQDPSVNVTSKNKNLKYNIFDMDSPHAELAAAKIKIESSSAELRELQSKLDVKENNVQDMKAKVQLFKENDARQSVLIQSLKEELQHSKQQANALEQITEKGSLTIQTLQSENREAQEKIINLEAKLRNHIEAAEGTADEAANYKRKYYDAIVAVGEVLETDTEEGRRDNVVDVFVSKIKNMSQEQLLLKSRVQTLDDALNAHSLETKASRETIMRLVSEVGKEQKNIDEISNALERAKLDKDEVVQERDSFAREVDLLKSRLAANDKTWASSREEMTQTASKANILSEDVRRLEREKNELKYELKTFCESLSKILSNSFVVVPARESAIKERIQELTTEDRDRRAVVEQLEAKNRELSANMEQQQSANQDSVLRIKSTEKSVFQKDNRLLDLEDELASGDVIRDTLRRDKTKYLAFLQEMSEAMKMEEVVADLGYDFNTDVLVARAHQLAKLESNALVEKTSSNYNLQRKVKTMKDELKNREMHMELLRKKISQLEEKNRSRNNLALDRDDAIVTVQRLHRKVERLQHALGDERVKVGQLKAELAEIHQLKTVTLEQRKKIDELVNSVGRLSSSKERQRQRLTSLKRNLSASELNADDRKARLEAQLETLGKEFKTNKVALDEVLRREKQLVDFRDVVARILGLDVSSLSVPDYEIISKLEKLIRNQHIGATAAAMDNSLVPMNYPFKAGYEGGAFRPPSPSRYHSPSPPQAAREFESSGPKRHYRRSRSSSPKRV